MNWKLIFQLSVFGLIMAFGTISLIPEMIEPAFWAAIFIFCAYIIARRASGKYFWHGLFLGLANCVWITAAHFIFYNTYITHHPSVLKMSQQHPIFLTHPRIDMLIISPFIGIVSGIVIGIFALIASLLMKKRVAVQ
jgi:hypothetical protein